MKTAYHILAICLNNHAIYGGDPFIFRHPLFSYLFYRMIYLITNSTASTYISALIFLSFAFPVATLITT